MLPQFRKYILVNNTGSAIAAESGAVVNVKETCWYINPATGKVEYAALNDDDMGFSGTDTLLDGAELVGDTVVDNTSNKYLGSQIQLEITHDAGTAADGTFSLHMAAGDAAAETQANATGYASAEANLLTLIGKLTWESNGEDDEVMRSNIFKIGG